MSDLGHLPLEDDGTSGERTEGTEHPYTMTISRLTIDKLGIKLYDRVSAVLAELISNAYDADAEEVKISLPWGTFLFDPKLPTASSMLEIVIKDDGHGMTRSEMNEHYLTVGADRRTRPGGGDTSRDKQRPVMGRKGIGKLAPFGICKTVEIISSGGDRTELGYATSHIILHLPDMLADTDREYHPVPGELDGTWSEDHGTTVKLRDFSRKRVPTKEDLDRQLAARFGLERSDWRVEVTNSVDLRDSFVLGRLMVDLMPNTRIDLDNRPVPFNGAFLPVTGYVAYSARPYKDEYMAGVRIYSRGKFVAQSREFGIGAGFTGEYKLRSYIVGELHAEWLDEEEDLIRSDRQDIIWSSDLGESLAAWGKKLVKELALRSDEVARKEKAKLFMQKSDLPAKLMQSAPADPVYREAVTEAAELLVKDVDPDSLNNPEQVERITNLAVSLAPHRSLLEALREVAKTTETTVDAVMDLFKKARIAEMYSLGQVAAERLEVVAKLESLVDDRFTLERPLQELIEQAPWILAPEWTPLGMNESLKRVRSSFESWYHKNTGIRLVTTAIENKAKEPDFVLLHDSGILWIVEIKRMGYHLTDQEYLNALGYLESLSKYLDSNPELGAQFPVRRLTFIVDHVDRLNFGNASSLNSDPRISRRTWHELLDATKRSHKDFLARVESTRHEWDAAAEAPAPNSYIGEQRRSPEAEGRLI